MNDTPRRSIRVRLNAEVKLRRPADKACQVQLRNLSLHGCSVDVLTHVHPGDRLWITLPGLQSIEGFVCWEEEFRAGIVFLTPLHPAVFDLLRQKYGH